MRKAIFLGLLLAGACHNLPAAAYDPLPLNYFARLPAIGGPNEWTTVLLSPDGAHFAAIIDVNGQPALASIPTNGSKDIKTTFYGEFDPREIEWATNRYLLIHFAFPTKRGGVASTETRLAVFDVETGKVDNLVGYEDAHELSDPLHLSQIQDSVVSRLPVDGEEVLVELDREEWGNTSVYSFALVGGSTGKRVLKFRNGIQGWLQDAHGVIRLGYGFQRQQTNKILPELRLIFRTTPDEDFSTIARFDPRDLEGDGFEVAGFTEDPKVIVIRDLNEDGRLALYKFDTSTSKIVETLFSDRKYDVGGVQFAPGTDRIVSVSYIADVPRKVYFDDGERKDDETLGRLYPGLSSGVVSRDQSGTKVIARASSEASPPVYYYFDTGKNVYQPLGSAYPELSGRVLTDTKVITYEARDGTRIDGYLTIPKGAEPKNLPMIVYPHGGPASRDYLRYDYWIQYFASRGWSVLQMNFRGSEGYGRKFEKLGEHQWGKAMQDDITDGVKWAITDGIADPSRICIVGGSFGGYAALQGAVSTPELYKCAVSLNGVSDMDKLITDKRFYSSYLMLKEYWAQGDPKEVSPVYHAKNAAAPMLIAYGTKDRVVEYDQSTDMISALRRAGKTVVDVRLEGGDHHLSLASNRLEFFEAMDKFLTENLGLGPVPDPTEVAAK